MPEETVRFYVAEIAMAADYLHSKRIVHRSVRPRLGRPFSARALTPLQRSQTRQYITGRKGSCAYHRFQHRRTLLGTEIVDGRGGQHGIHG